MVSLRNFFSGPQLAGMAEENHLSHMWNIIERWVCACLQPGPPQEACGRDPWKPGRIAIAALFGS